MVTTFTSSGNSNHNNFGFGATGYESCGVLLKNSLTPDMTGLNAVSITLSIRADTGGASTGTYKGFVQTAGGSTTWTPGPALSFSYVASTDPYTPVTFQLPDVAIENDGIVGITVTAFANGLDCDAWDTTDQQGDYVPKRGNAAANMAENIRNGMTVTITAGGDPASTGTRLPPPPIVLGGL